MQIRLVRPEDLQTIVQVEAACFPAAEAATQSDFQKRIECFPTHFWVLEEQDQLIGFINGMATDSKTIYDEMFENASLHQENGQYQAIFGLDVLPQYRRQGYAALLMKTLINDAKLHGRRGCILTCKEHLLHYYAKFGYKNLGTSESKHGGAVWYDMILEF